MKSTLKFLKWTLYCSLVLIGFTACGDDDPAPSPISQGSNGIFVLNQGSHTQNSAGVTFYDIKTKQSTFDLFNGGLGDTGQDMLRYGGKIYIAMYSSSNITVLDINTKQLIKRISVVDEKNAARQPRYLAAYSGKIYATTYDGNVIQVDTTTLNIEKTAKVGPNPEGIAAVNGKLYVANSDAYNPNGQGTTLSIVDIAKFEETQKLTVGLNPYIVHADSQGDVYLTYQGNFFPNQGGFQRIDTKTNTVTSIAGVKANGNFTIEGDFCYFYALTYNDAAFKTTSLYFGKYDVKNEKTTSDPIIDATPISTPYGIGVNPDTHDVYISNTDYATPGKVYVFDSNGKKINEFSAGINPCSFAFY